LVYFHAHRESKEQEEITRIITKNQEEINKINIEKDRAKYKRPPILATGSLTTKPSEEKHQYPPKPATLNEIDDKIGEKSRKVTPILSELPKEISRQENLPKVEEDLNIQDVVTLQQRLINVNAQTQFIDLVRPRRKLLLTKRSKHCRFCDKLVIKPELNPASTKFKIQLVAMKFLPKITIAKLPKLVYQKEETVTILFTNPIETVAYLKLAHVTLEDNKIYSTSKPVEKKN